MIFKVPSNSNNSVILYSIFYDSVHLSLYHIDFLLFCCQQNLKGHIFHSCFPQPVLGIMESASHNCIYFGSCQEETHLISRLSKVNLLASCNRDNIRTSFYPRFFSSPWGVYCVPFSLIQHCFCSFPGLPFSLYFPFILA